MAVPRFGNLTSVNVNLGKCLSVNTGLESCPPVQSEDNIEVYSGEEFFAYDADLEPAANEEEAALHLEELAIEIEEEQTLFSAVEDAQDSHTYIVQEVRLVK